MMPENRKEAFEWVLSISGSEEPFILTEKQYEVYKASWHTGKVFFADFEINPAFVSRAYKRKAEWLKRVFPCVRCNLNGTLPEKDDKGYYKLCSVCKGSGIDFKNQVIPQQGL